MPSPEKEMHEGVDGKTFVLGQKSESKMSWSSCQGVTFMANISHSNSLALYGEARKPGQWFSKETIHLLAVGGEAPTRAADLYNWLSEHRIRQNFRLLNSRLEK